MDLKKRVIAASLTALVVAGVTVAVLISGGSPDAPAPPKDTGDTALAPVKPAPTPDIIVDTPAPPQEGADPAQRTATGTDAPRARTPSPPSGPATAPASPAAPVRPRPVPRPDPWGEYATETRRIVEGNKVSLDEVANAVIKAFDDSDAPKLSSLLAPDEGPQGGYITGLAERYPPIDAAEIGANVNVFAQGQATIYMAYAIVTWTDAGITSTHTIPIPLRHVNGQWRLTSLIDTGNEIHFVQSVDL